MAKAKRFLILRVRVAFGWLRPNREVALDPDA